MPGADATRTAEPVPREPGGHGAGGADPAGAPRGAEHPWLEEAERLEDAGAERVVAWALERWGRDAVLGTGFQAEGLVLLDMAWRWCRRSGRAPERALRVFTIDTGRLPPETHELIERVRERYGVEVEVFSPSPESIERLVRIGGPNLFYRSPEDRLACCRARKVEPLERALAGRAAWITGLRREQSPTRAGQRTVETDLRHGGIAKISPLAAWTTERVWAYVEERDLPYHPLYDRGYTSIGCAPCTRPTRPGEDPRAGRWWWEGAQAKECGLHGVVGHAAPPGDPAGHDPVDRGRVERRAAAGRAAAGTGV